MAGTLLRRGQLAAVILAAAAVLVACGGSSKSSSSSNPGGGASATPASGPAMVKTTTGKLGTYLVDGSGRTLYLYTPDTGTTSTCYSGCIELWPAFVTNGAPTATGGAMSSLLGTTTRKDGSTEVTYAGHPLYYFASDNSPGETSGQGMQGIWFVVAPDGKKIS
jgi:predicted lipoprotein with Yx(FWY)xxD motif